MLGAASRWISPSVAVFAIACTGSTAATGAAPAEAGGATPPEADAGWEAGCAEPGMLCYDLGPLDVPPGSEWQGFAAIDVGNAEDLAITGMEIDQVGALSHHFIVSLWNETAPPPLGGPYELFTPEGLSFVNSAVGSTLVGSVFKYVHIDNGRYVGVTLPAHAYLVNNAHYLNLGTDPAAGHTRVRIHTVPKDQVRFATINALPGNSQISVPPGQTGTVEGTWAPPSDGAVLLLTSHMHRHGRLFEIWQSVSGVETKIYSTTSYDSPPLDIRTGSADAPLVVLRQATGDHLRFACTFENDDLTTDLVYGPSALTNEMCVMPVYYVTEPDALLALIAAGDGGQGFSWTVVPNGPGP
ncbi:MAG TPA: hypothetical protein VHE30_18960 [Polyangiaceae bacterium]|nr:hypothetical protein [Polyangiaceae bacterium]